jgi:hypothetical protein
VAGEFGREFYKFPTMSALPRVNLPRISSALQSITQILGLARQGIFPHGTEFLAVGAGNLAPGQRTPLRDRASTGSASLTDRYVSALQQVRHKIKKIKFLSLRNKFR